MSTTASNSPIEKLIAEYEAENCNFKNLDWVIEAAEIYALKMDDCQVRCLLYTLAQAAKKHIPEEKRRPPRVANENVAVVRGFVDEALQNAGTEISVLFGNRDVDLKLRTFVRSRKYKDGGKSTNLHIEVNIPWSAGNTNYRRLIHRNINEMMKLHGLPEVLMYITSGSQTSFNARLLIEGDEDYERCKNYSWYRYE